MSDPVELEVKDKIVVKLGLAQQCVSEACELGVAENPLAAELEVFKQMKALVFGLSKMVSEVQKLRFK